MIGSVSGSVQATIRDTVLITTGGVGYRVHVPTTTLARAQEGDSLMLWTHLAVREHAHDLFGFETRDELAWFELLLTVSGIGPRSALAVLNSADIKTLEDAIAGNNPAILARAIGIGKKTAEKIVLELKEKVVPRSSADGGASDGDVVDALVGLGYTLKEARDASRTLPKELEGTEARIREALRIVSGTKQ